MKKTLIIILALALLFTNLVTATSFTQKATSLSDLKEKFIRAGNKLPPELINMPTAPMMHIGTQNILVVLYDFEDVKPFAIGSRVAEIFNSKKEKSLQNYYDFASEGKFHIDFGKFGLNGWMRMPMPYSKYETLEQMMNDCWNLAKTAGADFSEYDYNDNGIPDLSIFVGPGNSWTFGGQIPGDFTAPLESGDRIIFCAEEARSQYGSPLAMIIHEIFHGLGNLWDLYDYSYINHGVGSWDIMSSGGWDGYAGLCAFSRFHADWMEIKTIVEPGVYEIDDLNGKGENRAYRIPIPGSEQEWLLLENRTKKGCDGFWRGVPGDGIVIYHVDDSRPYLHLFNTITKEKPTHGICVLDPGGALSKADAMYGANYGRSKITAETTPNTLPYRKGESEVTLQILDISEVGSKMTFRINYYKPEKPIMNVTDTLPFKRVIKGQKATLPLKFRNAGVGRLYVKQLKAKESWISLDRTSFIGNDEEIMVTVDTSSLEFGLAKGSIAYNDIHDISGKITILVDVVPLPGDFNKDGKVDENDFKIFIDCFGTKNDDPKFMREADLNDDEVIDSNDMMIMAKNFKNSSF